MILVPVIGEHYGSSIVESKFLNTATYLSLFNYKLLPHFLQDKFAYYSNIINRSFVLFMKRKFLFLIFLFPLLSFILNPIVYRRSHSKIEKLLVLPPVSRISIIGNGSKQKVDSSLSSRAFYAASKQLQKIFPDSVDHKYFSPDSVQQEAVNNFIIKLNKNLNTKQKIIDYKVPDSILQIFSTVNAYFVFCVANTGFLRTKQNFSNSYELGTATTLLFGIGGTPIALEAVISCFVLDLQNKNIIYFEREIWQDRDPTEPDVINLQLAGVVNHFCL